MGEPDNFIFIPYFDFIDLGEAIDKNHIVRGFAGSALNLFMAFVTDKQDIEIFISKALYLVVHFGHQWTGGINRLEIAGSRRLMNRRRDAVRREDNG